MIINKMNLIIIVNLYSECDKWVTCSETCIATSDQPIPKHVHMISLENPFSFTEWLSVLSVKRWIKPDKITVYTNGKQDSCWWKRTLPYINHQNLYCPELELLMERSFSNYLIFQTSCDCSSYTTTEEST